jgi:hypothetical protein
VIKISASGSSYSGTIFIILYQLLCTGHVVQVLSPRKVKNKKRCGEVTITSIWHIKFWSDPWHFKEEISEYYKSQFQTNKGLNFKDTSQVRSVRRTDSKSGFQRYVHLKLS